MQSVSKGLVTMFSRRLKSQYTPLLQHRVYFVPVSQIILQCIVGLMGVEWVNDEKRTWKQTLFRKNDR